LWHSAPPRPASSSQITLKVVVFSGLANFKPGSRPQTLAFQARGKTNVAPPRFLPDGKERVVPNNE